MAVNWYDLVPEAIAARQYQWERRQEIWRYCKLKQRIGWIAGSPKNQITFKTVADAYGISRERVRQIVNQAERHKISPVERYMRDKSDVVELCDKMLGIHPSINQRDRHIIRKRMQRPFGVEDFL